MEEEIQTTWWVQVFTLSTWRRFLERGGSITGFRDSRWNLIQKIKPGDQILCYLSGVSQFIAVLEVRSQPFLDDSRIWDESLFPCRLEVEVVRSVQESRAIPIRELSDLSVFRIRNWSLYLVASPAKWRPEDGRIVATALKKRAMEKS